MADTGTVPRTVVPVSAPTLPGAVRRAIRALEAAYGDSDLPDLDYQQRVDTLGQLATTLTEDQRAELSRQLTDAATRAQRGQFLDDVTRACARGDRVLVRVLDTGEEVWRVELSSGEAVLVVPVVPPGADAQLTAAIERSRQATFEGVCVCGGRFTESGGTVRIDHASNCPASDAHLSSLRDAQR